MVYRTVHFVTACSMGEGKIKLTRGDTGNIFEKILAKVRSHKRLSRSELIGIIKFVRWK